MYGVRAQRNARRACSCSGASRRCVAQHASPVAQVTITITITVPIAITSSVTIPIPTPVASSVRQRAPLCG